MKKIARQKPQDEQFINILKRVAKRVEEANVDLASIKTDIKFTKLRLSNVEHNTKIMKVDMEKLKFDVTDAKEGLENKLMGLETRLNKGIGHVADLITIELGGKLQNHEKRIQKIEHIQQAA